jgi:O-antigen/teichoic acid export membrane protein
MLRPEEDVLTIRGFRTAISPRMPAVMFIVRTLTLMSGTLLAQAITFGVSFALTRLYDPSAFGRYSIFRGLAGILGAASTGALDSVIVLARSDAEARRVGSVAILISIATALLISLTGMGLCLTGLLAGGLAASLPFGLLELALLLPMFIASYGLAQVFTYSNLRADRMKTIAGFKVAQSFSMGGLQVVASTVHALPGLIVGNVAGWLILGGAGLRSHFAKPGVQFDLRIRNMASVIRRHWRFPRYVMPNQLIDNLSNQIPIFLIGIFLSMSTAGHYGLAIMMLSAPSALLGQAVGQVFLQHLGRHVGDPKSLARAMGRVWLGMALIGAIPFATIAVLGPKIFGFAFGTEWAEAGVVASGLSALLFIRFASSPTSTMYLKLGMQREQWWFTLAAAVYRPAAYGLGAFGVGLETQILVHVTAEILAIAAYNALALERLGVFRPGSAGVQA